MRSSLRNSIRVAAVAFCIAVLAGCATGSNPRDPFESVNRGIYGFNEGVDKAILKPIAQAYRAVLPQFIRASVSNFFSNINDVVVVLNNLLQGKFKTAYADFGRIAINSTLGIGGLFDVASEAGIEKHEEDFGQTLGYWGIQDGPFVMLPFFGPSNVRDALGRIVDYKSDLVSYVNPNHTRNILWGTRIVSRRAELLDASTVLQTAALDPYEFVRDAYLQRRRNLIYDGAPPIDREFMDPPAGQKDTRLPQPPFPSAGEPAGFGSTLVGGETQTPVDSTYRTNQATAAPDTTAVDDTTAQSAQKAPGWFTRDTPNWYGGERLTPAELDALELPSQRAVAVAGPAPRHYLVRLWRSLIP